MAPGRTDTPAFIRALLAWPVVRPAARIALVSAFVVGGVDKAMNFHAAVQEQAHFGLQPAGLWAVLAIIVELAGSLLVIVDRAVWLGAGALGFLTFVAMLVANNFWAMAAGPARFAAFNSFFEHLGLIAGLVLAAQLANSTRNSHS